MAAYLPHYYELAFYLGVALVLHADQVLIENHTAGLFLASLCQPQQHLQITYHLLKDAARSQRCIC